MYFDVARTAIESLYSGRCTISIKSKQFNQTTKQTEFVDTVLIENQPCRLSYLNLYPSEGNVQRGSISNNVSSKERDRFYVKYQTIKLFISPLVNVPPGSKIAVTQNNQTQVYKSSGQPAVYTNHQEIELELFDEVV